MGNRTFCYTAEIGNYVHLYQDNSLGSCGHFCLNGQGNQPELMSYVLVLLLQKKKKKSKKEKIKNKVKLKSK